MARIREDEVMLTDRQVDVLRYINKHRNKEQCNPTMEEISAHFGWASPNAAQTHVDAMVKKGVITRRDGKSRGYVVAYPWSELGPRASPRSIVTPKNALLQT